MAYLTIFQSALVRIFPVENLVNECENTGELCQFQAGLTEVTSIRAMGLGLSLNEYIVILGTTPSPINHTSRKFPACIFGVIVGREIH